MYFFRLGLGYEFNIIFILYSIVVVSLALTIDSDFTSPSFDDVSTAAQDTLLPLDQTSLDFNSLSDPPALDLTATSLFDDGAGFSSSTDDALSGGLDLPGSNSTPENNLLWDHNSDNSFQLAGGCSVSPLGKSRVKRADNDVASSCANPAGSGGDSSDSSNGGMLPQTYDEEKHSLTCWALTLGLLPFALASSGDWEDIRDDRSRGLYRVTSSNSPYSPVTLYRATISMPKRILHPGALVNFD